MTQKTLLLLLSISITMSRSENKISSYFNQYIEKPDNEQSVSINMQLGIKEYLTNNIEYQKARIELKNFTIKNLPFGLLPSMKANFLSKDMGQPGNLSLAFSLSQIWESLFAFIYSPERKKLLTQITLYEQDGALQVRDANIRLARIVSSIRRNIKQYLAIQEELERITALKNILEENQLNDIFYLTEQLLAKELELYELQNELEELTHSHPTFYKGKVKDMIAIFFFQDNPENINDMDHHEEKVINIKRYNITIKRNQQFISYWKAIFCKLPLSLTLERSVNSMVFQGATDIRWNLILDFNPVEYSRYFVDIYYDNQITDIENKNRKQRLRSLLLTDMENKKFYQEQIVKSQGLLRYTEQLLNNEDKMSQLKPKRVLKLKLELIAREEEILLFHILLFLQSLIIFQ